MDWMNILEVHNYVFNFIDTRDLLHLQYQPINKSIYSIIIHILFKLKSDSHVYQMFLKDTMYENINRYSDMHIVPFPLSNPNKLFKNTKYRDFRQFVFYQSKLCKKNNKYKEFYLMSRLNKLYYVKEINENLIIMIFASKEENNVYYTFFENKIMMHSNDEAYIYGLSQNGYIIFRGKTNDTTRNKVVQLINNFS